MERYGSKPPRLPRNFLPFKSQNYLEIRTVGNPVQQDHLDDRNPSILRTPHYVSFIGALNVTNSFFFQFTVLNKEVSHTFGSQEAHYYF